jgi:small subunit ribosomal protein S8
MTINDPIADLLTILRNAVAVHKDRVTMPHSNLRLAVANLLKAEGYVTNVGVAESDVKSKFKQIVIDLKYAPNGDSVIQGIRKVSKPGQRIYSTSGRLRQVLGGVGISVVSTSQGLMTNHHARSKGLGGEVLFKIW